MPTYEPPKKNTAFVLPIALWSGGNIITNPTVVTSDFQVSTNGAAFGNINSVSVSPAGTKRVQLGFSASQMNGDEIIVIGHDPDNAWEDMYATIYTSTVQMDDLSSIGGGATPAEIWSYVTRTLTTVSSTDDEDTSENDIVIRRGDSTTITITGLGSLSGSPKLQFTLKRDYAEADSDALIQIDTATGAIYANGTSTTASYGSITITDTSVGTIVIVIDEAITKLLPVGTDYKYDVQKILSNNVTTLTVGTCEVLADYTRAIV